MSHFLAARFASFAVACVMTLAMLASINGLATSEPHPLTLARHAASQSV